MELPNKENASPTIISAFELERLEGKREGILEGKREGILEGKREGKLEGQRAARQQMARKLLQQQLPLEMIADVTELTIEEIKALQVQ